MYRLPVLSILLPLLSGAFLLVWRPESRKVRNLYTMTAVIISAVFVLGTVSAAWLRGSDAVAFHVFSLGNMLELAFRPDGPSLIFGGIIGVLWPITTLYAFSYMSHEGWENRFFGFFIMTFGVVDGIAFSANFFTMYLFYELMTLVTLPLVMHQMDGKARSAGKKYILYSMSGAALIFIVLVFLLHYGGTLDFRMGGVLDAAKIRGHERALLLVFVLGFFGFGAKAAVFPLHGWLPSASVAPTPVTALLHAVAVVKSGAFAVMRLIYFSFGTGFLSGTWAQYTAISVSAFTIAYGSIMALRMPHLKRRLAYSTVSNLSYILLAFSLMTAQGLTGGLLHMIFHAVIKITLFFCAGAVLHRTGFEYLDEMEGLCKQMPATCGVFLLSSLALIGVPPLCGFMSKWVIGTAAAGLGTWAGHLGAAALIVSAVLTTLYLMTAAVRFFFPLKSVPLSGTGRNEADWKMLLPLVLLSVLIVGLSLLSGRLICLLSVIGGAA